MHSHGVNDNSKYPICGTEPDAASHMWQTNWQSNWVRFEEETGQPDVCPIRQEDGDQRLNPAPTGDGRSERDAEYVGADYKAIEVQDAGHFSGVTLHNQSAMAARRLL